MRAWPVWALAFVLLAAAAFFALPLLRGAQTPTVEAVEHRWGTATSDDTEVLTTLAVRNPNPFTVPVSALGFTLRSDDVLLGRGSLRDAGVLEPLATTNITARTRVPHDALVAWWVGHLARGERSVLVLDGEAVVDAGGRTGTLPMPVHRERVVETDVLARLQGYRTCRDGGLAPCIENSTHAWRAAGPANTTLESRFQVRNPLPFALRLERAAVELALHNVTVARGETAQGPALPAQTTTPVNITSVLDHAALRRWWPQHAAACEASPATLTLEMDFGRGFVLRFEGLPAGELRTRLACP